MSDTEDSAPSAGELEEEEEDEDSEDDSKCFKPIKRRFNDDSSDESSSDDNDHSSDDDYKDKNVKKMPSSNKQFELRRSNRTITKNETSHISQPSTILPNENSQVVLNNLKTNKTIEHYTALRNQTPNSRNETNIVNKTTKPVVSRKTAICATKKLGKRLVTPKVKESTPNAKESKAPKADTWPWEYDKVNEVRQIPFSGKSGITPHVQAHLDRIYEKEGGITENDVFSLILDDDFWKIIVRETNLEANLHLNKNPPNLNTNAKSCTCWHDCSLDEIKKFFTLIILMGQIRKPSLSLYWSRRKILSTPIFNHIMPINRFKQISRYIRFARRDPDNANPLYRLQNIIDIISIKFENFYIPKKEVSIDESIVKFKGRSKFSHYIPNKASKRGFKLYKLCESKTAYLSKFMIVTNKNEKIKLDQTKKEELQANVGESIVSTLGKHIFNKGYVIYTDNFFTSPNLCKWLLDRDTYLVGTAKSNRLNFPNKFKKAKTKEKKMKDKELKYASVKNILALKFQDKKTTVHFLTSYNKQIKWITLDKKYTEIDRLECAHDYNKYMHGVDMHDQKLASFTIMRRHLKWYRKLFLYLLDMCILNASIIFHEYVQGKASKFKPRQLTQFRFDLVEQILSSVKLVDYQKPVFKKNPLRFNNNRCYLVKLEPTERKKNPTRKCVYCTSKKRRSETVYKCEYCGVALHKQCFPLYHTNNKNKERI